MSNRSMVPSVLFLCIWLGSAPAGVKVIMQETFYHSGAPDSSITTVFFIREDRLRIDIKDANQPMSYIFDRSRNVSHMIDHHRRRYTTLTPEDVQQMVSQVQSVLDQAIQSLQQQLKDLPPEQREMMEQMMKQQITQSATPQAPTMTLKKTGSGETIGPWICDRWEIYRDNQKSEVVWVTPVDRLPEGNIILGVFRDYGKFWANALETFVDNMGMELFSPDLQKKLQGIPVASIRYRYGQQTARWKILSLEEQSFPDSHFQPPSGYQYQEPQRFWQTDR